MFIGEAYSLFVEQGMGLTSSAKKVLQKFLCQIKPDLITLLRLRNCQSIGFEFSLLKKTYKGLHHWLQIFSPSLPVTFTTSHLPFSLCTRFLIVSKCNKRSTLSVGVSMMCLPSAGRVHSCHLFFLNQKIFFNVYLFLRERERDKA